MLRSCWRTHTTVGKFSRNCGCATLRRKRRSPRAIIHACKLVLVVVRVPVMLRVPLMRIFVPPLVLGVPAALALRRQFLAPVSSFLAVRALVRDGLVQVVVNFRGFALAVVRADRRGRKCQKTCQCRHCHRYLSGASKLQTILHERRFLLLDRATALEMRFYSRAPALLSVPTPAFDRKHYDVARKVPIRYSP